MLFSGKMLCSVLFTGAAYLLLSCFSGPSPVFADNADNSEDLYKQAEKCHERLLKSSLKRKFRQFWFPCFKSYKKVYTQYPNSPLAPAGLYKSGQLYLEFYQQFKRESDQTASLDIFRKIIDDYPNSPYKIKAETSLKNIEQKAVSQSDGSGSVIEAPLDDTAGRQSTDKIPAQGASKKARAAKPEKRPGLQKKTAVDSVSATADPSLKNETKSALDKIRRKIVSVEQHKSVAAKKPLGSGGKVTVNKVQYSSNRDYTRVVIHVEAKSVFRYHLLEKDPALNTPRRLYVDIENARLGAKLRRKITINDDILSNARTGQFTSDVVRVVMELKHVKNYNIFSLDNPFRIVVDCRGS